MNEIDQHTTLGTTSFAKCGDEGRHKLFSVNPDVPIQAALEYSAHLRDCASKLMLDSAMGDGGAHLAWAAVYLNEMAGAVVDDLALDQPLKAQEKSLDKLAVNLTP